MRLRHRAPATTIVCLLTVLAHTPLRAQDATDSIADERVGDDPAIAVPADEEEPEDDTGEPADADEEDEEDEDEVPGGVFVPQWDDEEDEDEVPGGVFVPQWDDEEEDDVPGGVFVPQWDDEEEDEVPGGVFVPQWDDEEEDKVPGGVFVPQWDDEEEDEVPGGVFVPQWDDEEEEDEVPGGVFVPQWDDEEEDEGGAPSIPTPASAGELTPDDDAYWLQLLEEDDEDEDENVDWDRFWQVLEDPAADEDVEVPQEIAEGRGSLTGVVVDDDGGGPLAGVTVTVEGTELTLTTGPSGRYYFELDPGFYTLRVRSFYYVPVAYEVEIEEQTVTDMAQVRLVTDLSRTMTQVVEGQFDRASVATQLMERRESTTVQDAVSAEQISQSGDSSASSAVRRVVGASIVDGKFLFVRGLGGRYTEVTLNGVPIPRTDPVYPGVELDIFPADLLASLTLYKNPQANLMGGFTGGLMDITTRSFPEEFEASVSLSVNGDTYTTLQDRLDYAGGSLDWLGVEDGTRALPGEVPRNETVSVGDAFGGTLSQDDVLRIGRSFDPVFGTTRTLSLPGVGMRGTVGDTLRLGSRRLGYLASARYSHDVDRRPDGAVRNVDINTRVLESLRRESGERSVQWGGLGSVSLQLSEGQDISLLTMFNRSANDRADVLTGFYDAESAEGERTVLSYIERSMWLSQLVGSHRRLLSAGSPFHETSVRWSLAYATAQRDEPDQRFLLRFETPQGDLAWRPNPGSGERFFSTLDQRDLTGSVDFRLPYEELFALGTGAAATWTVRDFEARRFRFTASPQAGPEFRLRPPNELFQPEYISREGIRFTEIAVPENFYETQELLVAGYGRAEVRPLRWLRLSGGVRWERFDRAIQPGSELVPAREGSDTQRIETDLLPSAGAVVELPRAHFLRLNYGQTVARPQINEFAQFQTQDYVRRRTIAGNPALLRTLVNNVDLRWEWFPTTLEVVSFTLFYKGFENPIERNILDASGQVIGFENALAADNYGAEFEARISLGHVWERLDDVTFGGNVAAVYSRVELPCTPLPTGEEGCVEKYTNTDRAMAGQSPFVINVSLGWEPSWGLSMFAFYNVFGDRISEVGRNGRPDEFELSYHALDLSVGYRINDHWSTRFRARNLLLQDRRFQVGDVIVESTPQPIDFSLSLTWDY